MPLFVDLLILLLLLKFRGEIAALFHKEEEDPTLILKDFDGLDYEPTKDQRRDIHLVQ